MSDTCPHTADIGIMKKSLKEVEIAVKGNGKDGLILEVDRLKREQFDMIDEVSTIARSMSDLADSEKKRVIVAAEREYNKKVRASAIEKVGKLAAIVFGAVATLYVILDYLK